MIRRTARAGSRSVAGPASCARAYTGTSGTVVAGAVSAAGRTRITRRTDVARRARRACGPVGDPARRTRLALQARPAGLARARTAAERTGIARATRAATAARRARRAIRVDQTELCCVGKEGFMSLESAYAGPVRAAQVPYQRRGRQPGRRSQAHRRRRTRWWMPWPQSWCWLGRRRMRPVRSHPCTGRQDTLLKK